MNESCPHCNKIYVGLTILSRRVHRLKCKKKIAKISAGSASLSSKCDERSAEISCCSCIHCGYSFTSRDLHKLANHARWCLRNPRRQDEVDKIRMASCTAAVGPELLAKRAARIKELHARGYYDGVPEVALDTRIRRGKLLHTAEAKENIRKAALAATHQRVCKSSHDFTDKHGRTFKFDSSWEDHVARRLDELDVKWDRPAPVTYVINGKSHKYFPDFYLPDHDLYLDPKNSYCCEVQQPKLEAVSRLINLVIIKTVKGCKEYTPPPLATKKSRRTKGSLPAATAR